jgi:stage II sporulation protein D
MKGYDINKFKPILFIFSTFIALIFILPTLIVLPYSLDQLNGKSHKNIKESTKQVTANTSLKEPVEIAFYRSQKNKLKSCL